MINDYDAKRYNRQKMRLVNKDWCVFKTEGKEEIRRQFESMKGRKGQGNKKREKIYQERGDGSFFQRGRKVVTIEELPVIREEVRESEKKEKARI